MFVLYLLNQNVDQMPDIMRSTKPTLELITYGGPGIMDKTITTKLLETLKVFNDNAANAHDIIAPKPKYSAIIYFKHNDPISYSDDRAYDLIEKVVGIKSCGTSITCSELKKGAKPVDIEEAKLGLKDVKKYQHLGKAIMIGSSPYNHQKLGLGLSVKEKGSFGSIGVDFISHAEYLEAHHFDFEIEGRLGWILSSDISSYINNNAMEEYDGDDYFVYDELDDNDHNDYSVHDEMELDGYSQDFENMYSIVGITIALSCSCCCIIGSIGSILSFIMIYKVKNKQNDSKSSNGYPQSRFMRNANFSEI